MKRAKFRLFFPDTLPMQLLLMLCIGILVLQGINLIVLQSIQRNYMRQTLTDRVNMTASRFMLMDSYTTEQREYALADLARYYDDSWSVANTFLPSINGWPEVSREEQEINAALKHRLLQKRGNGAPETRVRIFRTAPHTFEEPYLARIFENIDAKRFPLLEMAIQLSDGSWLSIMQSVQFDDVNLVWIQRAQLALVSIVFIALSGILIMRVTRPLNQLSQAAERFGKHPESMLPLHETGTREVREAARSFNLMRERIRDNLSERDRMLTAMAHDLRTPLARMQLRIADIDDVEARKKFSENCAEMLSIVNQGVELARSLRTTEKCMLVDMRAFVQSIADDYVDENKNVTLCITTDHALTTLTRPTCLRRCVANLLNNALRYAGDAEINLGMENGNIMLDILDNGPGIPEEELNKAIRPYYRVESSRNRDTGGLGLGLSIAYNMALLSNAELALQNRKTGGLKAELLFAPARRP